MSADFTHEQLWLRDTSLRYTISCANKMDLLISAPMYCISWMPAAITDDISVTYELAFRA